MNKVRTDLQRNQSGIISIMMTIVMIIVISLIVLGLAQISRREQRQSTDSQLSAQAFYAAESGVNDVVQILTANGAATGKTTCDNNGVYGGLSSSKDIGDGISYSCVLVDIASDSFSADFSTKPASYSLKTATTGPGSLTFSWSPPDGVDGSVLTNCPNGSVTKQDEFRTDGLSEPWGCPYGVLRVDLINASVLSRDALISNTQTVFLVPNKTGSVGSSLRGATCSTATQRCSYTFAGLSGNNYHARVSGIYRTGTLTISNGNNRAFTSIAAIDVTGKAQDVLRRIKVTVDLSGGNQNGDGGAAILSGDSICKRFKVNQNGSATVDPEASLLGCN